jgi:hypothetical protein
MERFQDALAKEIYKSVYNRVKSIKNSWWVTIVEKNFEDGEIIIYPKLVISQCSNLISALNDSAGYSIILNDMVHKNIHPAEYEWEENVDSDVVERYINVSILKISRKGDTVLWKLVEPEEILEEHGM